MFKKGDKVFFVPEGDLAKYVDVIIAVYKDKIPMTVIEDSTSEQTRVSIRHRHWNTRLNISNQRLRLCIVLTEDETYLQQLLREG